MSLALNSFRNIIAKTSYGSIQFISAVNLDTVLTLDFQDFLAVLTFCINILCIFAEILKATSNNLTFES